MSYPHTIHRVMMQPWAIVPTMHDTICEILATHIEGRAAGMEKTVMTAYSEEKKKRKKSREAREGESAAMDMARPGPYGTARQPGATLFTRNSLAVIPIQGVIGIKLSAMEQMCGGCSIEMVQAMVEAAYNDPSIKRVLFDVSSPGGMTYSVEETASMIAALSKKKETFSVTEEMQGSAAQWLASQVRTSYATSSAVVGSIGVFIAKLDESRKRQNEGTDLQIIKAGKYKAMGATAPLTDEEKSILQSIVDENYNSFTSAVRSGRAAFSGKKISDETMQGQIFSGRQGVANGLIDALIPSALSLVRSLSS